MYGMVNQAVRSMIIERYGQATWSKIHLEAGAPGTFTAMEPYDDSITYDLVAAVCRELSVEPTTVLRAFGEYWVANIATVHYERIMNSSGVSFTDFLGNLDHMHQRIRVAFPAYDPPSFRSKPIDDSSIQLDYYSKRQGLLPFVEGLLQGLAMHFSVQIEIEHIDSDSHRLPCKRMVVRHTPVPRA